MTPPAAPTAHCRPMDPRPPLPTVEDHPDSDDPAHLFHDGHSPPKISFKRRQKPPSGFSLFPFGSPSSSTPHLAPPEPSYLISPNDDDLELSQRPNRHVDTLSDAELEESWSSEIAGKRFYDDLTAIDWIFEYTKERLRLKALAGRTGIGGYAATAIDSSQVWVVLILTGVAAGLLAATIDIIANWLGDLKDGYCRSHFYLSRNFCCWGLDAADTCKDWVWWSEALKVSGSKGGSYVVEYAFYIMFSIVFATTASLLVKHFAPYARHSGIPEIKTVLGGFVIRRFMGTWTLTIKSLGLCLAESSGLWLGKEGPLVHVACCCANFFMKMFSALGNNEARKREVLSAAAAAGISVAFGSPIGGVLFSLEQLSYYFPDKTMWQSFVCATVAAVTLQLMNPFRTGKLVLYQVKYTRGWHDFEMVPFCILGILGGLYGAFFIRLNMKIAEWRKNSIARHFPVAEVVVVAIVTALINYPIVFMRPQSSELVANLFQECSPTQEDALGLCVPNKSSGPISLLLLSAALGTLLAGTTFGLQIPAGIILPSMAIGALYGRAMGMVVQAFQRSHPDAWFFGKCQPDIECVTPGMFAIIGAASALGGVTRMTVSIVVITFELTGALTYVLPIMVAVMLSKWVGDAFGARGIYESWIAHKQYPFLDNRDDPVPDVSVADVMTRVEDLVVVTAVGHTVDSLARLLRTQPPYRGFPVVTDIRHVRLVGYISRAELRFALDQAARRFRHHHQNNNSNSNNSSSNNNGELDPNTECYFTAPTTTTANKIDLRPWMDTTPITLPARCSLSLAANLFQKLGLRYILFATHGTLQGLLTKKDLFFILNAESIDARGGRDGEGEDGMGAGRGRERETRGLLSSEDAESVVSENMGLLGGG